MHSTDVFISYQRGDRNFARELKIRLEEKHHLVWMDENIPSGREWRKEINERLQNTILLVVIASRKSMTSAWVAYEWTYACLTLKKDFYWIQIDSKCNKRSGIFGLLGESRQDPTIFNHEQPNWDDIVENIEERLVELKEIRQAGEILNDLSERTDEQVKAAERLSRTKNEYHKPLARQQLLYGLRTHTKTTGTVQGPILDALWKIGGDLATIPYLLAFLEEPHEKTHTDSARALLSKLVARYNNE